MIEEIKKEISNLTTFNGGHNRMYISDLFKILDKYKDKEKDYLIIDKKMFRTKLNNELCNDYEPDCEDYWLAGLEDRANEGEKYKNAWEELREDNQLPIPFIELLSELMQNLEEKYGIEVE